MSDCVVNYIFPSTSTLLNPMRPSSQNLVRKVLLGDKPVFPSFSSLFCPEFDHMPNFFRTFCFHLGIVCFCNPMTCSGISREMAELFFATFPGPFRDPFLVPTKETLKQTNKQVFCSLCTKLRSSDSVFFRT